VEADSQGWEDEKHTGIKVKALENRGDQPERGKVLGIY
jgi:hypothetical protein